MSSSSVQSLNPELREYHKQYLGLKQEASDLVAGLTDAQFNWRPAEGRWSIGECLAHLNITESGIIKTLDKLTQDARSRDLRGEGPFHHGFVGNFFIKSMEPPYKMKAKTAPKMLPPRNNPLDATAAEFQRLQDDMLQRIERAAGLDLSAVREKIAGPLKLSLGQWIAFGASHARRHLWQARQVRHDPAFPNA